MEFRDKESLRILIVTNMYPTAERPGYGAFVCQQVEQLRQCGHVVDVVNILGFRSKLNYVKGALEVLQRTKDVTYDIVHSHYGYSAFPAWFRHNAPLVITLHGSDVLGTAFERICTRAISQFADAVIVMSDEMQKRIQGFVIPCGVDLNVFRPYDRDWARAQLGWPSERHLILFPFDPRRAVKRYDLAKAAVELLVAQGMDAELVTLSDMPNSKMPWCYSAADIMLLCSDREGSPTSVKEALACNTPVVATDVGDVREILGGVSGTCITSQDVGTIARHLREVLAISRSGKFEGRTAMARYDQTLIIDRIVGVYREVLGRAETKPG